MSAEEQLREALKPVIEEMTAAESRAQGYDDRAAGILAEGKDEARKAMAAAKARAAEEQAKAKAERETVRRVKKMIRAGGIDGIEGVELPPPSSNGSRKPKGGISGPMLARCREELQRFGLDEEFTRGRFADFIGIGSRTAGYAIEALRGEKLIVKTRNKIPAGGRGRKTQHYKRVA